MGLHQIALFINTFNILYENNKLVLFTIENGSCNFHNKRSKLIRLLERIVKRIKVRALVNATINSSLESAYFTVLFQAFCYMNKLSYTKKKKNIFFRKTRVLIIAGCKDIPIQQYVSILNLVLSAAKGIIPFDLCYVGDFNLFCFKEVVFMTGGNLIQIKKLSGIHKNLLINFVNNYLSMIKNSIASSKNRCLKVPNYSSLRRIVFEFLCPVCTSICTYNGKIKTLKAKKIIN